MHEKLNLQKLLFVDTPEGITSTLRPHWEEATDGLAGVVQAVPDMLEIVPAGTSKGSGVKMLLDHLGISPKEVHNDFYSVLFHLLLYNPYVGSCQM